jgi:hypothetical protein
VWAAASAQLATVARCPRRGHHPASERHRRWVARPIAPHRRGEWGDSVAVAWGDSSGEVPRRTGGSGERSSGLDSCGDGRAWSSDERSGTGGEHDEASPVTRLDAGGSASRGNGLARVDGAR